MTLHIKKTARILFNLKSGVAHVTDIEASDEERPEVNGFTPTIFSALWATCAFSQRWITRLDILGKID